MAIVSSQELLTAAKTKALYLVLICEGLWKLQTFTVRSGQSGSALKLQGFSASSLYPYLKTNAQDKLCLPGAIWW